MAYKVIITPPAQEQLDSYVAYTVMKLHNEQAARSILSDASDSKSRLSEIADSIGFCVNPRLKRYGYRKYHFQHHKYFMVFRIIDDSVIVEAMFHELQDYESLFLKQIGL